jgi:molybdopterin converting factor small subunit
MAKIVLWGSLKQAADGQTEIEMDAKNVREVLDTLAERYPKLKPQLDRGVSVSIDGVMFRDAWFAPIKPDSEVYVLPRMAGG